MSRSIRGQLTIARTAKNVQLRGINYQLCGETLKIASKIAQNVSAISNSCL